MAFVLYSTQCLLFVLHFYFSLSLSLSGSVCVCVLVTWGQRSHRYSPHCCIVGAESWLFTFNHGQVKQQIRKVRSVFLIVIEWNIDERYWRFQSIADDDREREGLREPGLTCRTHKGGSETVVELAKRIKRSHLRHRKPEWGTVEERRPICESIE